MSRPQTCVHVIKDTGVSGHIPLSARHVSDLNERIRDTGGRFKTPLCLTQALFNPMKKGDALNKFGVQTLSPVRVPPRVWYKLYTRQSPDHQMPPTVQFSRTVLNESW